MSICENHFSGAWTSDGTQNNQISLHICFTPPLLCQNLLLVSRFGSLWGHCPSPSTSPPPPLSAPPSLLRRPSAGVQRFRQMGLTPLSAAFNGSWRQQWIMCVFVCAYVSSCQCVCFPHYLSFFETISQIKMFIQRKIWTSRYSLAT